MDDYIEHVTPEEILANCKKEMDDMYDSLDEVHALSHELRKKSKDLEKRAKVFSRELQKIRFSKMDEDSKLNYLTYVSGFEQDFIDDLFMSAGLILDSKK